MFFPPDIKHFRFKRSYEVLDCDKDGVTPEQRDPASALSATFPAKAKKSRIVIPAKAGIQPSDKFTESWIPAFAGMTS